LGLKKKLRTVLIVSLVAACPVAAFSQSLADAAKGAQERRKKTSEDAPAKVYTEADIGSKPRSGRATFAEAPSVPANSTGAAPNEVPRTAPNELPFLAPTPTPYPSARVDDRPRSRATQAAIASGWRALIDAKKAEVSRMEAQARYYGSQPDGGGAACKAAPPPRRGYAMPAPRGCSTGTETLAQFAERRLRALKDELFQLELRANGDGVDVPFTR
jgi:hypothetical protein